MATECARVLCDVGAKLNSTTTSRTRSDNCKFTLDARTEFAIVAPKLHCESCCCFCQQSELSWETSCVRVDALCVCYSIAQRRSKCRHACFWAHAAPSVVSTEQVNRTWKSEREKSPLGCLYVCEFLGAFLLLVLSLTFTSCASLFLSGRKTTQQLHQKYKVRAR